MVSKGSALTLSGADAVQSTEDFAPASGRKSPARGGRVLKVNGLTALQGHGSQRDYFTLEVVMLGKRLLASSFALAFGLGMMAAASPGLAEEKSDAEKKYDAKVDECQQYGSQDEKQTCLDEAMKEYEAEKEKAQ